MVEVPLLSIWALSGWPLFQTMELYRWSVAPVSTKIPLPGSSASFPVMVELTIVAADGFDVVPSTCTAPP